MAWTGRNGKKRHNWTTNGTTATRETDELARQLLDGCSMLTPDAEKAIDQELQRRTPDPRVVSDGEHEPDPEVLAAMSAVEPDWEDPTDDDLREIEAEDWLAVDNEGI